MLAPFQSSLMASGPAFSLLVSLLALALCTTARAGLDGPGSPGVPDTCILLSENFDGVIAPALPPSFLGQWVTSTAMPDSPPNCAFVDDPASSSDKILQSALISINSTPAQLS